MKNEKLNGLVITDSIFESGAISPQVLLQALVGSILDFATTDFKDFEGWLYCDGRMLEASKHPLLFKKIGYKFGGSGMEFAIPDLRGLVTACASASEPIAKKEGAKTHILSKEELPPYPFFYEGGGQADWVGTSYPRTSAITVKGEGKPHNNMQPTIYLAKFIYCL